MMVRRAAVAALGVATLWAGWSLGQGEPALRNVQKEVQSPALMRAKLASTQRIVDGLVSKDFDDIAKGAEELIKICKATEWEAQKDEVYAHHRRELTLQADKMMAAAARENLDGAAYSYIHALTTCIRCHEYCRNVLKIARTDRVVPIPTTDEPESRRLRR